MPTIDVTPTSVNAEAGETAAATATFVVPSIGAAYGTVRLSLTITQSDSTLTIDPASVVASPGLTNCAFDPPIPAPPAPPAARVYLCEIANLATGGTYSISATIRSSDPGGVTYPVPARINAASSYTPAGFPTDIRTGPSALTTLTVLGTSVAPPPGLSISASCTNDVVTVVIGANTNNSVFLVNVGDTLDLEAALRPPGTYELPAGGASNIRVRVLESPDFTTVFDAAVPCALVPPPTTAAPTTAPPTTAAPSTTAGQPTTSAGVTQLPPTGARTGPLALAAAAVIAMGAIVLVAARRRTEPEGSPR